MWYDQTTCYLIYSQFEATLTFTLPKTKNRSKINFKPQYAYMRFDQQKFPRSQKIIYLGRSLDCINFVFRFGHLPGSEDFN